MFKTKKPSMVMLNKELNVNQEISLTICIFLVFPWKSGILMMGQYFKNVQYWNECKNQSPNVCADHSSMCHLRVFAKLADPNLLHV